MPIGGAEDQRLFIAFRVKLLGQLFSNHFVEGVYREVQLIFKIGGINLATARVDDAEMSFTHLKGNTNGYRESMICLMSSLRLRSW